MKKKSRIALGVSLLFGSEDINEPFNTYVAKRVGLPKPISTFPILKQCFLTGFASVDTNSPCYHYHGNHTLMLTSKGGDYINKLCSINFNEFNLKTHFESNFFQDPKHLIYSIDGSTFSHTFNKVNQEDDRWKRVAMHISVSPYVEGPTLGSYLNNKGKCNKKETLQRTCEIFAGLLELKHCGIFHRDLHLENIVMDDKKNVLKIIDFNACCGIHHKDELRPINREYGGDNDLHSLGQLTYKMSTGNHIYKPTVDVPTACLRNAIREKREIMINDPTRLQKQLDEKDKFIKDPDGDIQNIIGLLLKSKGEEEDYTTLTEVLGQFYDFDYVLSNFSDVRYVNKYD